jgi:hypothetical protein
MFRSRPIETPSPATARIFSDLASEGRLDARAQGIPDTGDGAVAGAAAPVAPLPPPSG